MIPKVMEKGIEAFDRIEALPGDVAALLAEAEREDFQFGAAWLRTVAAAALPAGARVLLLVYRESAAPVALLALQRAADGRLSGLAAPYTSRFRPAAAATANAEALGRAGMAFGRYCRGAGPLRLDALEPDWPGLGPLLAGFARAGMLAARFAHFGNWHLDLGERDWTGYLAGRPGELRETIRRRLARAGRDPTIAFELIESEAGLAEGIAAYAAVYAQSWKQPEPYPEFGPALLAAAATTGVLRLGVLRQGGEPIAAQYWTVSAGTATLHKLAHDERERALSPGTVLTALMLRRLIEHECVRALDFGRGDDSYKAGWTGQRRQRIGVLLCPPWLPSGLVALGRHWFGQLRSAGVAVARPQGGKA
jgi:hypothetical protein